MLSHGQVADVGPGQAQVALKTANGSTALHNAATNGHDAIVEILLLAGCSVNARAVSGATPLYGAASGGHLAVVKRLLAAGAEVRPTHSDLAALHARYPVCVCVCGCARAVQRLDSVSAAVHPGSLPHEGQAPVDHRLNVSFRDNATLRTWACCTWPLPCTEADLESFRQVHAWRCAATSLCMQPSEASKVCCGAR